MSFRAELVALLPRLWRFALVQTCNRQEAEDLVQATCVRALERVDQYHEGSHLDRWLMTVMHSIWQNELRRSSIRQREAFNCRAEFQTFEDGEKTAERTILLSEVLTRLEQLPEAQRVAMLLVYGEGMSYADAASTLGIPDGTLMSRLARARTSLKQQVEQALPVPGVRPGDLSTDNSDRADADIAGLQPRAKVVGS